LIIENSKSNHLSAQSTGGGGTLTLNRREDTLELTLTVFRLVECAVEPEGAQGHHQLIFALEQIPGGGVTRGKRNGDGAQQLHYPCHCDAAAYGGDEL